MKWLRRLLGLTAIQEDLRVLRAYAAEPQPSPPPPSVTVLVVGFVDGPSGIGKPRTMGARRLVDERVSYVELVQHSAMRDVSVIVFCDLERVQVSAIFNGTDLVTVGLGPCPIAFFPGWEPGVKLTVRTEPL